MQQVKPIAYSHRLQFANLTEYRLAEDNQLYRTIIFQTKYVFTENLHVVVENSMHPQRVAAWSELSSCGFIGPFFLRK